MHRAAGLRVRAAGGVAAGPITLLFGFSSLRRRLVPSRPSRPLAAPRLLIVDDDPELLHFLRTELEFEGYSCSEAGSGQQALGLIRNESWDLLLLDWSLPDFSGVEVCRRLRQANLATPVLMLTARDDVRERVEALDSGADDYLTKPFSLEELLARVRARLRRTNLAGMEHEELSLADLVVRPASRGCGGAARRSTSRPKNLTCCCCSASRSRCSAVKHFTPPCEAPWWWATTTCWMCMCAICAARSRAAVHPR